MNEDRQENLAVNKRPSLRVVLLTSAQSWRGRLLDLEPIFFQSLAVGGIGLVHAFDHGARQVCEEDSFYC